MMVIESFEPITWYKKLEDRIGPLNGQDWRTRWHTRMQRVFETEIVLVGEAGEDGDVQPERLTAKRRSLLSI